MKKILLFIFFLSLVCWLPGPSFATTAAVQVEGSQGDLEKAREFFDKAQAFWNNNQKDQALGYFESAVLTDRNILQFHDRGMGDALLQKYREKVEKEGPSPELLYRLGYFENVVGGRIQESIDHFRAAEKGAPTGKSKEQALAEIERLNQESRSFRYWEAQQERMIQETRAQDLAEELAREAKAPVEERIQELTDEKEELEERLQTLNEEMKQEKELLGFALRRASRYRRDYYNYWMAGDTSLNPYGPPNPGVDQFLVESNGNQEFSQVRSAQTDINNYYFSRHQVELQREVVKQIGLEIAGLKKRQKEIEEEIDLLENPSE